MPKLSIRDCALSVALLSPFLMQAQAPPPGANTSGANTSQAGAPRASGTIKAITSHDFVLTTASGDIAVTVPEKARILLVPPGSKDLSAAQPGTIADIAAGDRAIVNGTAGDPATSLNATRVLVIKSTAIAARNSADQAAWAHGAGGLVRSADPATGIITVVNGARTLTVDTSAKTIVRRYAGASVRFQDAVLSDVAAIHPGDQLRARGERSPDGTTVIADEIVTGSFGNFSGVLSAIDPVAGTLTLKDLATKQPVTVTVSDKSDLRRLPPGAAQTYGARGAGGDATPGSRGAQPVAAGGGDGPQGGASGRPAGAAGLGGGSGGGTGRAGLDLSRIVNRLPSETLAGLKPGDAVLIVASNNPGGGGPTAITLVVGVEQILAAHPTGETTLSPWSLGGGGQGEGEGGGGPQ